MFILANFLFALARILEIALTIAYWLILIRALISWVSPGPFNPIVQFLHKVTEPLLEPIRKILPFSLRMGIDLSPIIAFLLVMFLKLFLVKSLIDIGLWLKLR